MIFSIKGYKKTNKFNLGDINFDLDQYKSIALVGPNGSGKTTIINILSLLERCDSFFVETGTKKFNPFVDTMNENEFDNCITIFDENPFFEFLTCNEQFQMLKNINKNIKYDRKKFERLCQYFEFEGYRDYLLKDLSMGNLKKVQIILVLSSNVPYVFMDEPTNGLDTSTKIKFADLINKEKAGGRRFIISSHQLDFIANVADNYIFLENGHVKESGEPEQLIEKYALAVNENMYSKIYNVNEFQ